MNSVSHTKEEASAYWKNITALLTKLPQASTDSSKLLKKIQEKHTAYLTGKTHNKSFIAITTKRTMPAFNQMEKYWKKLFVS